MVLVTGVKAYLECDHHRRCTIRREMPEDLKTFKAVLAERAGPKCRIVTQRLGAGSEPAPQSSLTNPALYLRSSLTNTSVVLCVPVSDGASDRTGWGLKRCSSGANAPVKLNEHSAISRIMLNGHYAALDYESANACEYSSIAAEAVFARSGIEQNDVGRIAIILQTAAEHCYCEAAGSCIA